MKTTHILILVVVALALGVIIMTFTNSSTYADFEQATAQPGKEFHIIGKLDTTKPVIYNAKADANRFSFYMTDNAGKQKLVVYNNNKPQDFEKSESVVVIGKMTGDTLHASSMLLKCPSKYNEEKKPQGFGEKKFGQ
jgi:cytochrome c-type biogenesis protein CcmE